MSYPATSSSSPPPQEPPGLIRGQDINIYGGHFVQHNESSRQPPTQIHTCSEAKDGFQHLQGHVSTAAFDPKEKMDAPKCHPNTRIAVLDLIINWILHTLKTAEWIMWLNGAAGAGKSAIGRSIVERCLQMKIPIARVFFFRTDSTRNTIDPIVATLAHQLIKCLPDLRVPIVTRMQEDPLIFLQSLETQFQYLIFDPLVLLKDEWEAPQTVLLLFDGLDELSGHENQVDLINIMANFISSKAYPLIVFFGSRNEYQIKQAFESKPVCDLLRPLPLDNNYKPDDDIRLFLDDSFSKIRASHPHRKLLHDPWPTSELVDEIVTKSSGQFIYASVVVKFISMPKMHPAYQLEIIRGLRPAGALTPFAQLDALYLHIFSQVEEISPTMYILAGLILCNVPKGSLLSKMFPDHISEFAIPLLLASLSAVIHIDDDTIKFLHTSLPDFLLDHMRSQDFYIDRASWSAQLAIGFVKRYNYGTREITAYAKLLRHAQPTEELRQKLLYFYPFTLLEYDLHQYLLAIKSLDFGDGGEVYRLQLKNIPQHIKWDQEQLEDLAQGEGNQDKEAGDKRMEPVVQKTRDKEAGDEQAVSVVREAGDERVVTVARKQRSWGVRNIARPMTSLTKRL